VNVPGLSLPDFYGPGASLTINEQSFRHPGPVPAHAPEGRLRVLCVGDSFTLGIGVDDSQTWCRLLGGLDPLLETVNLGEAGYGLDQIHLKYEERGRALEHQVLIFAFIEDSFRRMRSPTFLRYPKPLLRVEDGVLKRTNVPVPEVSRLSLWLARHDSTFGGLRLIELGRRIGSKLGPAPEPPRTLDEEETRRVVAAIMDRTGRICHAPDCVPFFVFLKQDLRPNPAEQTWRTFLAAELRARALDFVDLAGEMAALPRAELEPLFDPRWAHYSVRGNEYVARALHRRLVAHGDVLDADPAVR
jgi:hypothetical protein